jgi:acetyltransferase-like isoleucine patch superfamily enzyme
MAFGSKIVESIFLKIIPLGIGSYSGRFLRFLAMYYPDAEIRKKCWIRTGVKLGSGTYLNPNVVVTDVYSENEDLLEIGNNCSIAPGVVFAPDSSHNNSIILREAGLLSRYEKREKIIVGNDVWIGANCTILPGIKIGNCCIIGANSMVNKNIPDFSLAYGNPVKIIKDLRV